MYKNSALLSIGTALVLSLFFVDGGHAFQIDRNFALPLLSAI